jgi:hypothetical protein
MNLYHREQALSKQVIVFPRGQLSAKDKGRFDRAGILAVEADDPTKVVSVLPNVSPLRGDDMLLAALFAVAEAPDSASARMVRDLYRRAKANELAQLPQPTGTPPEGQR